MMMMIVMVLLSLPMMMMMMLGIRDVRLGVMVYPITIKMLFPRGSTITRDITRGYIEIKLD